MSMESKGRKMQEAGEKMEQKGKEIFSALVVFCFFIFVLYYLISLMFSI